MNKLCTVLTIIFPMAIAENTCIAMYPYDHLPVITTIDLKSAADINLVNAFKSREKAALWKELGVLIKNDQIKSSMEDIDFKYVGINSSLTAGREKDVTHKITYAEAMMYFLLRGVTDKNVDEILDISDDKIETLKGCWDDFKTWANAQRRELPKILY